MSEAKIKRRPEKMNHLKHEKKLKNEEDTSRLGVRARAGLRGKTSFFSPETTFYFSQISPSLRNPLILMPTFCHVISGWQGKIGAKKGIF
jgi:hypothetical protein